MGLNLVCFACRLSKKVVVADKDEPVCLPEVHPSPLVVLLFTPFVLDSSLDNSCSSTARGTLRDAIAVAPDLGTRHECCKRRSRCRSDAPAVASGLLPITSGGAVVAATAVRWQWWLRHWRWRLF